MVYVRGFLPWIVFDIVATLDWRWGALAAFLVGVGMLMHNRRGGMTVDAMILDFSTTAYFAALAVFAIMEPQSSFQQYDGSIALLWLALTAWTTLAVRSPFTLGIARQRAPREVWQRPEFLRLNMVLSTAWAVSFTLAGAAAFLCTATDAGAPARIACQLVGVAAGAVFTNHHTKRFRAARLTAAEAASL